MADIYIESLNISAMSRNLKKLTDMVVEQNKTIKLLKKDQRLCFDRLEEAKKSSDSIGHGNIFNDILKGSK